MGWELFLHITAPGTVQNIIHILSSKQLYEEGILFSSILQMRKPWRHDVHNLPKITTLEYESRVQTWVVLLLSPIVTLAAITNTNQVA